MTDEPMIATKERLGAYDAIETAKPHEPLFAVQGGDPFGPATVLHWASLARAAGMEETDAKASTRLLRKASDAEQVAWAMMAYQRGEVAVEGKRAYYNDAPSFDDSDHDRAVRQARIKGADRINDMVARGTEIAGTLAALDACPDDVPRLRAAIETLRSVATFVEPRREMERS